TDLTVSSEEIERRHDEVLVQMWEVEEDGRVPDAARLKVPDVVDNRRTLRGLTESGAVLWNGGGPQVPPRGPPPAARPWGRRRLAECLFSTALHVTDPKAEAAACRMEHILDPEVADSICAFLGHPLACPHGRSIPRGRCCDLPILS